MKCKDCIHFPVCCISDNPDSYHAYDCKHKLTWIPLTQESVNDLEDHCFYLVADKRYGTPMKAKYHDEGCFQILSQYHYDTKNADIWSWEFGESDCPITHYMKMPDLPWKEK